MVATIPESLRSRGGLVAPPAGPRTQQALGASRGTRASPRSRSSPGKAWAVHPRCPSFC